MKLTSILTKFCLLFAIIFTPIFAENTAPFQSQISAIPDSTQQTMQQYTWHPGCPVPIADLVYIQLSYWGFDHKPHRGELIVNKQLAGQTVNIFKTLYQRQFPIEKMQLIEEYQGNDEASLEANNTAAFNCRLVTGSQKFSQHSYGRAIDINPLQNPYVRGNKILPFQGKQFLNRNKQSPGMITQQSLVYQEFKKYGWKWGGDWRHLKDYHHFEKKDN